MNTKIVFALVAASFIAGMLIQAIPAQAAPDCKKNENSSCWIRVSQLFETTLKKLQSVNHHFEGPSEQLESPPADIAAKLRLQLAQMDSEVNEIQNKQTDWEFILERAG